MTMKETYTPWRLFEKERWSINPLTTGIYLNTVFGSDFWYRQPSRYPDAYYEYFSTKVRANVFLGPSLTYNFPNSGNQWARSVSFFCEASTCDFYIRSCVMGNGVAVKDVISLSLGAKVKFF